MLAVETELKFEVSPRDLRRLMAARVIKKGKPASEEDLLSGYYDTPSQRLKRKGVTLRVRHSGDKRLQTVKTEGGTFKRGEWEDKIKGNGPDLRKARRTALAPLLTKKLTRGLAPIFETRVHRTSVPGSKNGSWIEVALDDGHVRVGRKSAPIAEVELELKRGDVGSLFRLARAIGNVVSAKLALKSKSERGYDLIEGKSLEAVRADRIKLRRSMSATDAFRSIGRSILRQITANEPAVG